MAPPEQALPWAIIGAATLVLYDVVAALQPITFGRVYAAYGGIFIALTLA